MTTMARRPSGPYVDSAGARLPPTRSSGTHRFQFPGQWKASTLQAHLYACVANNPKANIHHPSSLELRQFPPPLCHAPTRTRRQCTRTWRRSASRAFTWGSSTTCRRYPSADLIDCSVSEIETHLARLLINGPLRRNLSHLRAQTQRSSAQFSSGFKGSVA